MRKPLGKTLATIGRMLDAHRVPWVLDARLRGVWALNGCIERDGTYVECYTLIPPSITETRRFLGY